MKIFIPVVGQFTNIGDVLHRRELLSWLKGAGQLNVYVGKAPKSFIDGLKLDKDAVVYSNLRKWLWAICCSKFNHITFVFNPGEIRLGLRRIVGEIALFPFQLLVRIKGGKVMRVGIAAMSNSKKQMLWFWKILFLPTSDIYWRTFHSKELFSKGKVIPDLAFYDIYEGDFNDNQRTNLTISMRADCPIPSDKWFQVINEFSKNNNLNIIIVSQVRMDNSSTIEIAKKLNGRCVIWPDEISHIQQEIVLNEIYLKTKLILSDRLHVLIAACSKGAIPVNILSKSSQKVDHHFEVLNLKNISVVETESSEQELYDFLHQKIQSVESIREQLKNAKKDLDETRIEILNKIKN